MPSRIMLVGAAFPRTGTISVKYALERMGLGRSYHMHELFLNPHHCSVRLHRKSS